MQTQKRVSVGWKSSSSVSENKITSPGRASYQTATRHPFPSAGGCKAALVAESRVQVGTQPWAASWLPGSSLSVKIPDEGGEQLGLLGALSSVCARDPGGECVNVSPRTAVTSGEGEGPPLEGDFVHQCG